ncbi:hypothetical protein [Vallitalea guaymasensis]|uniref:hypothetical protein n=1 Tax=Vallitalea guaymasensis TaxID=1185412 RepID=UPI002357F0C9|nr:hypothetical protein [Vallitalea guaymasensis]
MKRYSKYDYDCDYDYDYDWDYDYDDDYDWGKKCCHYKPKYEEYICKCYCICKKRKPRKKHHCCY